MNALQVAMLEDKIKEYVISELKTMKGSIINQQNKAIKNVHKKHANQTRRLARGLTRKIKENDSVYRSNLAASNVFESSRMIGSNAGSILDIPQTSNQPVGSNIVGAKLIEDIQEAVATEQLNCKPIEGADIPLKQVQYGKGGELLLVQDLEHDGESIQESEGISKTAFEQHFKNNMHQYLVPSGFKNYQQQYLDEEDLTQIKRPAPAPKPKKYENKTEESKDLAKRKKRQEREQNEVDIFENNKEIDDPNITAAERDKTIKLMVKLLSRHIDDAQQDMDKMKIVTKQTEDKIQELQKDLNQEEVQVAIDDIKRRKDQAEKEMEQSRKDADDIRRHRHTRLDDVMVENEVMLAEVQVYQKKRGYSRSSSRSSSSSGSSSLSDEEINRFIKSAEKSKRANKKKPTTFVGPKKSTVSRPKTAVGRGVPKPGSKKPLKPKKSKPMSSIKKKIRENNWNPDTSSAYGIQTPIKSKAENQKLAKANEDLLMEKTKKIREKNLKNDSKNKKELEKLDKQLNDEVSRAFEDMAEILNKYE